MIRPSDLGLVIVLALCAFIFALPLAALVRAY